jgi:hypothetical protein
MVEEAGKHSRPAVRKGCIGLCQSVSGPMCERAGFNRSLTAPPLQFSGDAGDYMADWANIEDSLPPKKRNAP